jgi:coenzyme F420-reducing hydrogenase delta subunit
VAWVQNLLDEIGLDGRRLFLNNMASGDNAAVNQAMDNVLKNLAEVGPNPAV